MTSTMKIEAGLLEPPAVGVSAVLAAAPAVFEPAVSAPMLGTEMVGTPVEVPWTDALPKLATTGATITASPED